MNFSVTPRRAPDLMPLTPPLLQLLRGCCLSHQAIDQQQMQLAKQCAQNCAASAVHLMQQAQQWAQHHAALKEPLLLTDQ